MKTSYTRKAIELAQEAGYWSLEHNKALDLAHDVKREFAVNMYYDYVTSDPLFWQSLGKALGGRWKGNGWKFYWHRFIDHLNEGKDAESFFKELLHNYDKATTITP